MPSRQSAGPSGPDGSLRPPEGSSPLARLMDLSRRTELYHGELEHALRHLAEIASDLVDTDRVNVWVLEDDGATLRCVEHYDRRSGDHDAGMTLGTDRYPAYFDALPRDLVLAVEDAPNDSRTAELAKPYLEVHGIGALLDAPIRREGDLAGVVCHEHVGGPRRWTERERHRAGLVADFVALALEARHRRALEEKYRNLFDLSQDMIFVLDGETGRFLETNRRAADALGYAEDELIGMSYRAVHPEDALADGEAAFRETLEAGNVRFLSRFVTREGRSFPVEIAAHRLELEGRAVVQAVARDVSDWVEAQQALRSSERRYRELFERNVAGVFRSTPGGTILDANGAFARILGYDSADELLRMDRDDVEGLFANAGERERLLDRLRADGAVENYEVRLRRRDGGTVWALENSSLAEDPETGREVIEGTLVNVTERKRLQEELERMAYHDSLTELPNRRMLRARAEATLARARREESRAAMVYLDLRRFKRVNDTLGHAAGDRVLVETARRLEGAARDSDTVARVGGDEFAVLLADVEGEEGAHRAAQRLAEALDAVVYLDGEAVHLDARLGIALFPDHGEDLDTLLTTADAALYQPGPPTSRNIRLFTPSPAGRFTDELVLEREVHRAVEQSELELYFQPIVRGADGAVEGVEALLRWRHPERGILAASEFIHLAERTPLIHRVDRWAVDAALASMAAWQEEGRRPEWVSVNLSASTLRDPAIVDDVRASLEAHGVEPGRLVLEVTERIAVRNPEQVRSRLKQLRETGVRVALDDFGTGHSALAYLHQLPADLLKMDGIFVQGLGVDPDGRGSVADAILRLGRAVGMRVVAERVETDFQRSWLCDAGCDLLQGYFLGEPVPPEELRPRLP